MRKASFEMPKVPWTGDEAIDGDWPVDVVVLLLRGEMVSPIDPKFPCRILTVFLCHWSQELLISFWDLRRWVSRVGF